MKESMEAATHRVGVLLRLSALFSLAAGLLLFLFFSSVPDTTRLPWYEAALQIRYSLVKGQLGVYLVVFGATALMLWDLSAVCRPKRLAYGFVLLHFTLAVLPVWQLIDLRAWSYRGSYPSAWVVWAVVQLMFAAGFLREALKAPEPDEEEEVPAREDARRSWLRSPDDAGREERRRLARDLHDSIKQQIFSVKMSAAAAEARWESDPAGARAALADIRRSAQAAMVEMQSLLRQLRPEAMLLEGLVEALREQCEALEYRSGASVHFELGDLPAEERLRPRVKEQLFRIAQEALSNIARHARARHVHVWLGATETAEGPFLALRIWDDGQGFDPDAPASGMGLRNIRERVQSLPGKLVLESAPARGTELRIYLPLRTAEVAALGADELRQAIERHNFAPLTASVLTYFASSHLFFALGLIALTLTLALRGWRSPAGSPPERVRSIADLRRVHIAFNLTLLSWWSFLRWPWEDWVSRTGMGIATIAMSLWAAWCVFHQFRTTFGPANQRDRACAAAFVGLLALLLAGLIWGGLFQRDMEFAVPSVFVGLGFLYLQWGLWIEARSRGRFILR